jgi:uncharacterized membrane protein
MATRTPTTYTAQSLQSSVTAPGILLGLGLGGFVDGIVLHQILQWHNMLSARLPPTTMDAMRVNMAWDGFFHVGVWTLTLIGVVLLWSAGRRGAALPAGPAFAGQLLLGWGIFNLVEGIIDHHVLEIHHVVDVPAHVPFFDWVFLAVGGVVFIVLGWRLSRSGRARDEVSRP